MLDINPSPSAWHPSRAVAADYSSRSNLALAFLWLGREKRVDMNVFYTFCRLVDDIADTPDLPLDLKREQLAAWREVINSPASAENASQALRQPLLAVQVRALMTKYRIHAELMEEIIAGVEMDLASARYETFEELRAYCYRVASAVGLVSIEIFGYRDPGCRQYAVDLGLALQLTNIIRDVGVDLENGGRIYLPLEDLTRFGYSVEDLRNRVHDHRFTALMQFETQRAEEYFQRAIHALPSMDRRAMVAAEIMRTIYHKILVKVQADGYQVFAKRYRLSKPGKMLTLLSAAARNRWGACLRKSPCETICTVACRNGFSGDNAFFIYAQEPFFLCGSGQCACHALPERHRLRHPRWTGCRDRCRHGSHHRRAGDEPGRRRGAGCGGGRGRRRPDRCGCGAGPGEPIRSSARAWLSCGDPHGPRGFCPKPLRAVL